MARLNAVFIALCMVLIAGSVGAVLYLYYGFLRIEAAVIAVAVLTGLALFNALTARARDRADVGDQIADLSRGTADLARQVADIGRRLSAVETEVARSSDNARTVADPLAAEIGVLGGLVKELADSVTAHEAVLTGVTRTIAAPAITPAAPPAETAKTADRAELGEPESDQARPAGGRFKGLTRGDVVALIRRAVEANRVDLYLQPIVTLPQRKVRYYEALARLRSDDGELLQPADFLEIAESGGLMPMIDNVMLFRCVQVVRRLAAKNREIGLFCNVAPDTLIDSAYFPQFSEFMAENLHHQVAVGSGDFVIYSVNHWLRKSHGRGGNSGIALAHSSDQIQLVAVVRPSVVGFEAYKTLDMRRGPRVGAIVIAAKLTDDG